MRTVAAIFVATILVVALVAVTVALTSVVLTRQVTYEKSAACVRAHEPCKQSVLTTVGDLSICQVFEKPIGADCDSACYVTGTPTTCDGTGACLSTNASACLGHCTSEFQDGITELNHPGCEDKFVFKNFSSWNTSSSSKDSRDWLYYTDYVPDCNAWTGCMAYATYFKLTFDDKAPSDWYVSRYTGKTCVDFLNMTSTECIESFAIPIEESIATPFMRAVLNNTIVLNLTNWHAQADACIYYYKCVQPNMTALTDPVNLRGKRSVGAEPTREQYRDQVIAKMHQSKVDIAVKLGPIVQQAVEEEHDRRRHQRHE